MKVNRYSSCIFPYKIPLCEVKYYDDTILSFSSLWTIMQRIKEMYYSGTNAYYNDIFLNVLLEFDKVVIVDNYNERNIFIRLLYSNGKIKKNIDFGNLQHGKIIIKDCNSLYNLLVALLQRIRYISKLNNYNEESFYKLQKRLHKFEIIVHNNKVRAINLEHNLKQIEFIQQNIDNQTEIINSQTEIIQQTIDKSAEIIQQTIDKSAEFIQQTIDNPSEIIQQTIDKSAEFIQQTIDNPAEIIQQTINNPAEIIQQTIDNQIESKENIDDDVIFIKVTKINKYGIFNDFISKCKENGIMMTEFIEYIL